MSGMPLFVEYEGMVSTRIGDCDLMLADARDVLPQIAARRRVHLLCTDAPYELTSGGKSTSEDHKQMQGKFARGVYDNGGSFFDCIEWSEWLPLAYAALLDDAEAYVMCNDKHVTPAGRAAADAGFKVHNVLVWEKPNATPTRNYMKNLEFVHYLYKGRSQTINNPGSRQKVKMAVNGVSDHPCEKPVALMKFYIEQSTQPGDIVLDPFMGSGTTGVAAALAGRQFLGIEKDPEYFDVAVQRISAAVKLMKDGGEKQMAMGGL